MRERRDTQRPGLADAHRDRVDALAAVEVEVEDRRRRRRSRRPRDRRPGRAGPATSDDRAADRDPRRRRREAVGETESVVAEPGEALGERIERRRRRRRSATGSASAAERKKVESTSTASDASVKAMTSPRPIAPLGSSRPAVRGLRASMPASISRLSAIAALRAATMATVIQNSVVPRGDAQLGQHGAGVGERAARRRCARS